ncbi:hypothetical protein AMTRI_Chr11g153670 [Amborella trichopoda]
MVIQDEEPLITETESHPSPQPPVSGGESEYDLIIMGNKVIPLATLRGSRTYFARREPIIGSAFVVTSFSGQVIHPLVWCIRGGFVVSQATMSFPTQLTRLNHRNVSIDNGHDLLRVAYQLFSQASLFELIMFPSLAKRLIDNLLDFEVPCTDLLKTKVTEMAR